MSQTFANGSSTREPSGLAGPRRETRYWVGMEDFPGTEQTDAQLATTVSNLDDRGTVIRKRLRHSETLAARKQPSIAGAAKTAKCGSLRRRCCVHQWRRSRAPELAVSLEVGD